MADTTTILKKWLPRALFALAMVLIALMLIVNGLLPWYLQARLLPQALADLGLTADRIDIRRIGLTGADLGPLALSTGGQAPLALDAVQIDYSPRSLLHGDIQGIAVSGLRFTVSVDDQALTMGGFKMPLPGPAAPAADDQPQPLEKWIPVRLDGIRMHNTLIELLWHDHRLQIPIDIDLDTAELPLGRLQARIDLSPRGNPIALDIRVDQPENTLSLALKPSQVMLESLADVAAILTAIPVAGLAEVSGKVEAQLTPFEIKTAELSARLTQTRIAAAPWQVQNRPSTNHQPAPIELSATLQGGERIDWSCGPLRLAGPMTVEVAHMKGHITQPFGPWEATASVDAVIPAQPLMARIPASPTLQKEVDVRLDANVRQPRKGFLDYHLRVRPRDAKAPLAVWLSDLTITGDVPDLTAEGTYGADRLTGTLQTALHHLNTSLADGKIQIPECNLDADLSSDFSSQTPAVNIALSAGLSDILAQSGTARVSVPLMTLEAQAHQENQKPFSVNSVLKIARARMAETARGVAVDGIELQLPLQWPPPDRGPDGRIDVRSVVYQKRPLGDLKGRLFQQGMGVAINARHQSKLIPELTVTIQSKADINGVGLDFALPVAVLENDLDLGQFAATYAGYVVGGRIQAQGRLDIHPASIEGSASVNLTQGRVHQEELGLDLAGIDVHMDIKDLINLRSGPGQKLHVASLRFGDINAKELNVDFQVEPETTLLIERAKMKWCLGLINTNALRIRPGEDDYDLTLICDRLNLAMVLRQLGAAQGEGEGAVSGVIPIRWAHKQLHFDNGFLYSTPGEPGTIALQGTEFLLKGLPPGSPQHTQLDIATEALKDYTYNWAKLSLESRDDILLIKLQLDGKPNRLLPFAYDKQLGTLKRIEGEGEAEFKGISIDLNFKSPINEILNYRDLLNSK